MAAASTNGKGKDGDQASSGAPVGPTTHESAPGDSQISDPDLEVLERGSTLGRYLVLERLGAGAMGVVYAAYDPELDRKVAIKILRPAGGGDQERRRARLVREAKAIAKVSHPNVVGIFDVGVHQGRVFLAMEHLAGGTLGDWMAAAKRPWRETVRMFTQIAAGLAAAHAEGLIHRDFKPDNVLLDKSGKPKVVDFGLVRLTTELALTESTNPDGAPEREETPPSTTTEQTPQALTRTGALTGTPAYMAPEQFLGKAVEARSDQFAFCVALCEALYGERPFAGTTVFALADSVTGGRVSPAPKNAEVPVWLRRALLRGLETDPNHRYASMEQLAAVLQRDPERVVRRRLVIGATALVVAAVVAVAIQTAERRRREIAQQVAEHMKMADAALAEAESRRAEGRDLRSRALAAFDDFNQTAGEQTWAQRLAAVSAANAAAERGIQKLEAAFELSPNATLAARLADAIADDLTSSSRPPLERAAELKRLAVYDRDGAHLQRFTKPAIVQLTTEPSGLQASIERYDETTFETKEPRRSVGQTPLNLSLAPGSYRISIEGGASHTSFEYPVLLSPGETVSSSIHVPARPAVPVGFAFIPQGRFLFGSSDEETRQTFLLAVPLHEVTTGPFLISRHETTLGEWIDYLKDLPRPERERRRPQGKREAAGGFIDLHQDEDGSWELSFRAATETYRARQGQPFVYGDRKQRASQDWRQFPVAGVSPEDISQFTSWLNTSGRVPGARLCTEREWERGARGADGRLFPHGRIPLPDDANFDLTYSRKAGGFGPDVVGSHPGSSSPFGLQDMVGNVWEIALSTLDKEQIVVRGSSFYLDRKAMLIPNREPIGSVTRDHTVGFRVCADPRW
jgi:formylglycine-generating enzyme required for sulfatase activity